MGDLATGGLPTGGVLLGDLRQSIGIHSQEINLIEVGQW